jgi:outer membrane lipoprotein carrier protein
MGMSRWILALGLSLLAGIAGAQTNSASDQLIKQLGQLKSFRAQFTQTTFDDSGSAIQKLNGDIAAEKPGKLYWSAKPPYEQLLVSDGKTIYHYDKDLEQVSEKPFSDQYGDTPAVILSGNSEALRSDYDITLINANEGKTQLFTLVPHDRKRKMFDSMEVRIEQGSITGLTVLDNLAQKTEMQFKSVVSNQTVDAKLFQFTIPKGVDVIREQ